MLVVSPEVQKASLMPSLLKGYMWFHYLYGVAAEIVYELLGSSCLFVLCLCSLKVPPGDERFVLGKQI